MRNLDWENKGTRINGTTLNNLRFADDIVLLANSRNELQEMISELEKKGKEAGLKINIDKTKILSNKEGENIALEE